MNVYIAQSIGLIFCVPSVVLYVLECGIIICYWRKQFNNTFYKIFLATAFNNIILNFLLFTIPIWRIQQMGWLIQFYLKSLPFWMPKFLNSLSFFCFHVENFLTVMAVAHRLSAILWPMDFEGIWRKLLFPAFLTISCICSLALTWPTFALDVRFFPLLPINGTAIRRLTLGYQYIPGQFNSYELLTWVTIGFFVISTLLNAAIIVAYKRHKSTRARGRDDDNGGQNDRLQFRLMIYTILLFAAQTVYSAYWVFSYIYTLVPELRNVYLSISEHYVWISDLRMLVFPSWFLYWASSEISGRINRLFSIMFKKVMKKFGIITKIGVTNNNNSEVVVLRSMAEQRRKTFPIINRYQNDIVSHHNHMTLA